MFLPHRVDVTDAIANATEHNLEIDFDSALLKAREIKDQHPEHKWVCFNGDSARLAVRKAQYHWGWDWGPLLMCAGIWRPVRLEIYSARITDIRTETDIAKDGSSVTIKVCTTIEGHDGYNMKAKVSLRLGDDTISTLETDVASNNGQVVASLGVRNPELWMPNGYGTQTLYHVDVALMAEGIEIHKDSRRIGIRSVELVQQPDSHGKSFYFRINGVDIFCGGSCWIPTDSFLTNVTPKKYRAWIELMVPANQKMIR